MMDELFSTEYENPSNHSGANEGAHPYRQMAFPNPVFYI
jgi:hypothetical protein